MTTVGEVVLTTEEVVVEDSEMIEAAVEVDGVMEVVVEATDEDSMTGEVVEVAMMIDVVEASETTEEVVVSMIEEEVVLTTGEEEVVLTTGEEVVLTTEEVVGVVTETTEVEIDEVVMEVAKTDVLTMVPSNVQDSISNPEQPNLNRREKQLQNHKLKTHQHLWMRQWNRHRHPLPPHPRVPSLGVRNQSTQRRRNV